ncbi:MAG: hypothetical protein WD716_13455 [Fimbriimonadaceae bacterium]
MKKRGKSWVVVAIVALTVALLACALVFREQPPYEFLRGEQRAWTIVTQSPPYKDLCETQYESERSVEEIAEKARQELAAQGWERIGNAFYTPGDNAERIMVYAAIAPGHGLGKTVIRIERIANPADRFIAWIDDRLGRPPESAVQ